MSAHSERTESLKLIVRTLIRSIRYMTHTTDEQLNVALSVFINTCMSVTSEDGKDMTREEFLAACANGWDNGHQQQADARQKNTQ